ncbi:hypothetical protein [Caloramator sp. mosi_1]
MEIVQIVLMALIVAVILTLLSKEKRNCNTGKYFIWHCNLLYDAY